MDHDEQKGNRHGPAAMLAILLSILLGASPAAAWSDVRPAGFKQAETAKSAALLRTLRRASDDDRRAPADRQLDGDAALPPSATSLPVHRHGAATLPRLAGSRAGDRPAPFRARAPPAA